MNSERPPSEFERQDLPSPEHQAQIKALFEWVDSMHGLVRRPVGMSWIEMQIMLFSLHDMVEWVYSDPQIDPEFPLPPSTPPWTRTLSSRTTCAGWEEET